MASLDCSESEPMVTSTPMKSAGACDPDPSIGSSDTSISSQPPKYEEITRAEYKPACMKSLDMQNCNSDCAQEIHIEVINSGDVAYNSAPDDSRSETFNLFSSFIQAHNSLTEFYRSRKQKICAVMYGILGAAYLSYFLAAIILCSTRKDYRDPTPLIVLTSIVITLLTIWFFREHFGEKVSKCIVTPVKNCRKTSSNKKLFGILKCIFVVLLVLAILLVIALSVWSRPKNLISLVGLMFFIIVLVLCSAHPTKVNWRPVLGGLFLQFIFATLILKWDAGYQAVTFLGDRVQIFLSFTNNGTEFVFGKKYTDHFFAMKVLPVIVFFSCAISVMYYLGAMQVVINKIAWVMRISLGTTAAESLCAAGNIFIGQTEAPILIRPYLDLMTKSELNAVMTGGFATIAGGVLAAYIEFGVPPVHLLCASVMNAPCALAVSKILYPETEESRLRKMSDLVEEEKKERNVLEAAAGGASSSIKLVANIAANLIAFLAMLAFVNAVLSWFGSFVGVPDFSFHMICSYLLMPVAYLMGVDWEDAGIVGQLIGIKTFLNEFIAYSELGEYIKQRAECVGTAMSVRSEVIATYALCGFSNLSSIGIQLGALGPMAPHRKGDLANVVMRSLLGGIVTCLMTASVAGLLVTDFTSTVECGMLNSTMTNGTTVLPVLQDVLLNATGLPTYNTTS